MASNYTEHYGLPIWKPEDNFLRTEFNDAHEKIDAAMGELAQVLATKPTHVLLMDSTTTAEVTQVSADLSGIDLTAWREITVRFSLPYSIADTMLRINGSAESIYYQGANCSTYSSASLSTCVTSISWSNGSSNGYPTEMTVTLPLYMAEWPIMVKYEALMLPNGFRWNMSGITRVGNVPWSSLQTVDAVCSGGIPAGTHIQVWGVK